jgi:gas vesicle protein
MSKGKIVLGTVAGLAIGAIAGVLFAPEKGSTTRNQIKDKSNDYAEKLKSKWYTFRDSLSKKTESIKNDAEEMVDKGKERYDDAKKVVKNAASNIKQDVAADNNQSGNFSFNDKQNN